MPRICKVLIVENDDFVRILLADIFEREGYGFSTVASGAEMHRALDEDDFDIVVIDVTQPGQEDGFVLAQIARGQDAGQFLSQAIIVIWSTCNRAGSIIC